MNEFKRYFRQGYCEARPYILGEALTGIAVNKEDAEEVATTGGGMILRNPENHQDQWYVSKAFFAKNYGALAEDDREPDASLSFGVAIQAMKKGKCVARAGWNGKGMFVFLVPAAHLASSLKYGFGEYIGEPTMVDSFAMKTADNKIVIGWLASQTDMQADDWMIVE